MKNKEFYKDLKLTIKEQNEKGDVIDMKKYENRRFRLRVWKMSYNGNCLYTIPVSSLEEAALICNVLAYDDLIEEKMGAAPDYVNSISLEMWHPQLEDWVDALDEDGFDMGYKELCNKEIINHLKKVYETGKDFDISLD